MHSPLRRAAKALAGLVVAAGFALAAAPPGGAASIGEGRLRSRSSARSCPMSRARLSLSSRWITAPAASRRLTAIPPPASSSRMSSRALSAPRSRASPSASTAPARAGPSRPIPTTSSAPMRAIADLRRRLRQIPNIRTNAWNTILLPRGFRATGRGGVRAVFAWVLDNGYAAGDGSQRACEVRTAEPARTAAP